MSIFEPKTYSLSVKHFLSRAAFFIAIWLLLPLSGVGQSEEKRDISSFEYVIYQYPFQYFYSSFKLGIDVNVNNRLIIGAYTKRAFSYAPRFYSLIDEDNPLGVDYIPNYIDDAQLGVVVKSFVGKNATIFHGYYLMTYVETGSGWESYYTQSSAFLPKTLNTNGYKYQKFGVGFGRYWTLFNQSVLDINLGIGFYDFNSDVKRSYELPGIFEQLEDQPYLFATCAFGIGKRELEPVVEKDYLQFKYGLTLDFNAMLKNSMEAGLLFHPTKKGLWHVFARYGNLDKFNPSVTRAVKFQTYSAGLQFRMYPYGGVKKDGVYFAWGLASGHTEAESQFFKSNGEWVKTRHIYDPQHLMFSMGFTTYLVNQYLLEGYISNTYTVSPGKSGKFYPHPDEATGIQTIIGLKFGMVRLNNILYERKK